MSKAGLHASKWARFIEPEDVSYSRETIDALGKRLMPPDAILERIVELKPEVVMIGEGSHGSHEYYQNRIDLTKSLIERGQCQGVLIEGDWPDTSDLNRFVMGHPTVNTKTLDETFLGFERFPSWMWANEEVRAFVQWLALHNAELPLDQRCGVWGMDLYSLHLSMKRVLEYLEERDKEMYEIVKQDYSCFGEIEPQTYGLLATRGLIKGCHLAAVDALVRVSSQTQRYAQEASLSEVQRDEQRPEYHLLPTHLQPLEPIYAQDDAFIAEINAQVVVGAEEYYRAMFNPTTNSWNLRDTHFFKILERVQSHIDSTRGIKSSVVAWAHNSHLGDARATHLERLRNRDLNLGQLVREVKTFPRSVSVGQLCFTGTVCAATEWGDEHDFKAVNPGLPNSHEDVFHSVTKRSGLSKFALDLHDPLVAVQLAEPRLQRAIGVIYRPDTERLSHYYKCDLVNQYDFLLWDDVTTPVTPLAMREEPAKEPETFPTGL